MKKFNYKEVSKNIGWNFSNINYEVVVPSNYNYYKEVISNLDNNKVMLDIGCGSGEKTVRYYTFAKKVYMSDIEDNMLKKVKDNINKYYSNSLKERKKFKVFKMDCNGIYPFKDDSFDVVVSRHCGANMREVYRVLKDNGVFISEDVSSLDCKELKDLFNRGQGYNEPCLSNKTLNECYQVGFKKVELLRFEEIEYYKSKQDLIFLLSNTPILDGYDEVKDDELLEKYIKNNTSKKGIKLIRRLYAFKLVK